MFSWCCCRCRDDASGLTEERVKATKTINVGLSEAELAENDAESNTQLESLRDTAAERLMNKNNSDTSATPSSLPTTTTTLPASRTERSHLSTAAKEQEREKLKALVHEFAKKAASDGFVVNIFDPKTNLTKPFRFEMDKYLMWFTLTPLDTAFRTTGGDTNGGTDQSQYMMTTVTSVSKGRDITERIPEYTKTGRAEESILVDFANSDDRLFFIFSDPHDRRKFYTCLKIIRTGGAGYIGSHTVIELQKAGYRVTVLDNFSNSSGKVIERLEELCGEKINSVNADLREKDALIHIFKRQKFDAVIHYAGLKSVVESVLKPIYYYKNNIIGTLNLIEAMEVGGCKTLVFSSSATVYKPSETPLKETDPLGPCNPYGQTKFFLEQVLHDIFIANTSWKISVLRYFNPIGAHPSGRIGESPAQPMNLVPFIQQVAVGRRECLHVFGNDWNTPDGTGVRDYLHVEDLASGHVAALKFLEAQNTGVYEIHNLGTGKGVSVLEMVKCFEEACGKKIPIQISPRRPGDLATVIADPSKAEKELGWKTKRSIKDACVSAWKWQSLNPYGYDDGPA